MGRPRTNTILIGAFGYIRTAKNCIMPSQRITHKCPLQAHIKTEERKTKIKMEEKKEGMLYWLKLEKDFFDHKEIKKLRQIENGDTYTLIYLKMLLASLSTDGKLYFDGYGDSFAEDLALTLNEKEEDVDATLSFLTQYGFITKVANDEYYMTAVLGMTGKKTESAVRKQKSREAQKEAMCDIVTQMSQDGHSTSQNVTQRREDKSIDIRPESDTRDKIQDSRDNIKNENIRPKQIEDKTPQPVEEKSMADIWELLSEIIEIEDCDLVDKFIKEFSQSTGYTLTKIYELIYENQEGIKTIDDTISDMDDEQIMQNVILRISPSKSNTDNEAKGKVAYSETADEGDGELPF